MVERKDVALPPIDHFVYNENDIDPIIIKELEENKNNLDKLKVTF